MQAQEFRAITIWTSLVLIMLLIFPLPSKAEKPKRGGTLVLSIWGGHQHLDGRTYIYQSTNLVVGNLYSSLVKLDKDFNPMPDLADRWEMKNGGRTWIFYLHPGAKFHDGTPADATAVKWNFDWLVENKSWKRALLIDILESVEVISPTVVKFNLKGPVIDFTSFLATTGHQWMIVSPTATEKYGDDYPKHPVGSGPFRFVEWVPGSHVTLERNPDYFRKGLPYLDKIEAKVVTTALTNVTLVRTGKLDLVLNAPSKTLPLIERLKDAKVLTGPHVRWMFATINMERPPFDDLRVRQAVACYGVDREAIARIAYNGQAKPLVNMLGPDAEDYIDLNYMCPYDPDKAKALLREAGAEGLEYPIMVNTGDEVFADVAQVLQDQLKRIGVNANIELVQVGASFGRWGKRDYTQFVEDALPIQSLIGLLPFSHPDGARFTGYPQSDRTLADLMTKWRFAQNKDEKRKYSHEYQKYVVENMYWENFTTSPYFEVIRNDVKGYYFTNGLQTWLGETWLDR